MNVTTRGGVNPDRLKRFTMYLLATATVVWHVFYAYSLPLQRSEHAIIHLGLFLGIYFLHLVETDPQSTREKALSVMHTALVPISIGVLAYVLYHYDRWLNEARNMMLYTNLDVLAGGLIIALVTYACWRAFGNIMLGIIGFTIVYALFGYLLPGIFHHGGQELEMVIYNNSVALDGVFGSLLRVSATWVAIFVLFAGIVEGYGGLQLVIYVGKKASNIVTSGVAQIAVISSMFIGTFMASTLANTATTGSFTIPLMKDAGIRAKTAAAIESVAGNGGQIMPPVMGTSAFIMADILGISYFAVLAGAVLPAILFYVANVMVVHLIVEKTYLQNGVISKDGRKIRQDKLDELTQTIRDRTADEAESMEKVDELEFTRAELLERMIPVGVALGVLIYTLVILRWDPLRAGAYTVLTVVPLGLLTVIAVRGPNLASLKEFFMMNMEGFRAGVINMAPLAVVLSALGIVVQIVTSTGLSHGLAWSILAISGGVFVVVVVLTAATSILFGMGMPTAAAYIIVSILTAPILTEFGLDPLVAHMFVFYFAILSSITPPIALASAIGAGIAGTAFWDTAIEAVRIGTFAYLIPFAYITNPELIVWQGTRTAVLFALFLPALMCLSVAMIGYVSRVILPMWQRVIYFVTALAIVFTPIYEVQIAIGILATLWLVTIHVISLATLTATIRPGAQ